MLVLLFCLNEHGQSLCCACIVPMITTIRHGIISYNAEGIEPETTGQAVVKEADLDNIAVQGLRPVRREISWHRKRQLIMSNEPFGWRSPSRSTGKAQLTVPGMNQAGSKMPVQSDAPPGFNPPA